MSEQLHTVLGAAGGIGLAVVASLQKRNLKIRAVGRSINLPDVMNHKADLMDPEQANAAIAGSEYVYLCVGLPYSAKFWADNWPLMMRNVIEACAQAGAKLIFLDNIYMYGPAPLSEPFDENHVQSPPSKKGKVRKQIADQLMSAISSGKIQGLIGRAADIYGADATNSVLYVSFLDRMMKGKPPLIIAKPGVPHTFVDTRDIGESLVLLALDENTYGQVWHLPVGEPKTMEEITAIFNDLLGASLKPAFMSNFFRKLLSLFIPILREVDEMYYQFEHPYIMSFDKFKQHFPDFKVTPYEVGLQAMIDSFQNQK